MNFRLCEIFIRTYFEYGDKVIFIVLKAYFEINILQKSKQSIE